MRRLVLVALLSSLRGTAPAAPHDPDAVAKVTRVDAALAGFRARLVVRYTLDVRRAGYQDTIELPDGALAVGATAIVDGVRHPIELVDAVRARARMTELLERHRGATRRSGLLIEKASDTLDVHAATPRPQRIVLELAVDAPACFRDDQRHVVVPAAWRSALASSLRLSTVPREALEEACERGSETDVWLAFPSPPPSAMGVYAGRLPLTRDFARLEIDVASELGAIPQDLATAIVVDGSRSMTREQLAAQRELVAAYLRAAPDSRVQVIAFARRSRALLPSWTTARAARATIARALDAVVPANGSNVDVALDEAGRWLATIGGTRRVLLVGDDHLATRLRDAKPAYFTSRIPAKTLVHVARVTSDNWTLDRADDVELADVAAATEGMAVLAGRPASGIDATQLVRPISIDDISIVAPGWTERVDCPWRLEEGHSCTWWGEGESVAEPIVVEGMRWGTKLTRIVRPDRTFAVDVARELSTRPISRLPDDLADQIEVAARAVGSKWSLFGSWGGRGGHRDRPVDHGPISTIHTTSFPHGTFGSGVPKPAPPAPALDLAPQLRNAVSKCHATQPITAHVETTLSEIVDVAVELGGAPLPADAKARLVACIDDAIWETAVEVPRSIPRATTIARFP